MQTHQYWHCEACGREFTRGDEEPPGAHLDGEGERCSGAWTVVDRPSSAVANYPDENQA